MHEATVDNGTRGARTRIIRGIIIHTIHILNHCRNAEVQRREAAHYKTISKVLQCC